MSEKIRFHIEADEVDIFVESVNESLQMMEAGVLAWEQEGRPEQIADIFRAIHSVKGMAGMIAHDRMVVVAHAAEEVLAAIRAGEIEGVPAMVDDLLQAIDSLRQLREEVITGVVSDIKIGGLVERLEGWLLVNDEEKGVSALIEMPTEADLDKLNLPVDEVPLWLVGVWAAENSLAPAARLYQAGRELAGRGTIWWQRPLLEKLAPGDMQISTILSGIDDVEQLEAELLSMTEIAKVTIQRWTREQVAVAWSGGDKSQERPKTNVEHKEAQATYSNGTVNGQIIEAAAVADKSVRINIDRLDRLMNLVGELVTNRTRLMQIEEVLDGRYQRDETVRSLGDMVTQFSNVVSLLQDEVMRARLLPLEQLFQKMPRLVRDLARQMGKEVELEIEGAATELDRSLIELINDPLIHLIRNAMGHGLELPDEREVAGKPRVGMIRLTATAAEGKVILTVEDDGRGIDVKRIGEKAVAEGIVSENELAEMNKQAIIDLIFMTNFSTAGEVTAVSGRGVGLDVVRTNVAQFGGAVVVESELGVGSRFILTLPLTLAIVQTMLVEIRGCLYAVPMAGIIESMYVNEVKINTIKGAPSINWREQVLPLLDLREFFADERQGEVEIDVSRAAIITVQWGHKRAGLIVDRIHGQQEIVVKAFSPIMGHIPGLSGATILGDGQIALIIDVPNLLNAFLRTYKHSR
ncbi:MAG TPA: chemotaxis protein CheA [Anaerolineae bacterium]|nr:chemotaxis protein CheA [Anaerolineae bacterium]